VSELPPAAAVLVPSGNARLFALAYPRSGAETVILLHGGPGVPMDFSLFVAVLFRKHQVITFDQRGTARSPAAGASYSVDEYMQDLDAIARHFGAATFHLFGHPWGGLYAQIFAVRHPERVLSLFLCSPSSGTGPQWTQTEREVLRFNRSRSTQWEWARLGVKSVLGMTGSD
jgi:proline iminopeptidase